MDKAVFRADDHTYWLGDRQLISATQLMSKHGLSKNLSHIPRATLDAKAARGTHIHSEIEAYIVTGETGFTKEFSDFVDFAAELGLVDMQPEAVVNDDLVAGTADLFASRYKGKKKLTVLIDYKTGLTVDKEAARWQLSIYERLSGKKFDEMYVMHLCEKSALIPIERIEAEELNKLFEAESNGDYYIKCGLVVADDLLLQAQAAEQALAAAVLQQKQAEEVAKTFRQMLYDAMTAQNIKQHETADKALLITRVDPTTQTRIDSDRLKKDLPDIAEKYSKTTNKKGYVQITLREG